MIFFNCLSQVSRNVKGMYTTIYYNSAFSVNIRQNEILRQETGYTTKTVEKLCSRTKHKQFPKKITKGWCPQTFPNLTNTLEEQMTSDKISWNFFLSDISYVFTTFRYFLKRKQQASKTPSKHLCSTVQDTYRKKKTTLAGGKGQDLFVFLGWRNYLNKFVAEVLVLVPWWLTATRNKCVIEIQRNLYDASIKTTPAKVSWLST